MHPLFYHIPGNCIISIIEHGEYGLSEYYARDALDNSGVEAGGNLCVTDCYQQYLLKFYYGLECENTVAEEADKTEIAFLLFRQSPAAAHIAIWKPGRQYKKKP